MTFHQALQFWLAYVFVGLLWFGVVCIAVGIGYYISHLNHQRRRRNRAKNS